MKTLKDVKVNETDFEKKTALHHAAAGGHIQTVRKLIEMKAIIDCLDKVKLFFWGGGRKGGGSVRGRERRRRGILSKALYFEHLFTNYYSHFLNGN